MANTQITTDYVANKLTTPFVASLGALRFANTEYTSIFEKQSGQGVPLGTSVQMRLQPTYPALSTTTTINGAMNLQLNNFQQETIDINVDEFIYSPIELNVIEEQLRVGTAADIIEDQYIQPARKSLQSQVNRKIYNSFVRTAYYQIGDGSAELNDALPVGNLRATMTSLNIDKTRYLGLSPFDEATINSEYTKIFNDKFSTAALEMGLLSPRWQGFETYEDEHIEEFEAGTSSAATAGTLTLAADITNGATAISITNTSGGSVTFKPGDAVVYIDSGTGNPTVNYWFVSQIDRRKVPPTKLTLKSVIIAPNATDIGAGTFPTWDVPSQTYIVADAATALVKISREILTDFANNFAYINANYTGDGSDVGTIPAASIDIQILGNRNVNMGLVKNGLYIASPAPTIIKNSDFTIRRQNGLSVVVAEQGVLFPNFSNYSLVGLMIGVRFNPQGIAALNTASA